MGRLAVIGGNSLLGTPFALDVARRVVEVDGVGVIVRDAGDLVFLQRHGENGYTAPHLIDHRRHLHALCQLGCDRVLALSSVGSLRRDWGVGTVVVPDDFVALDQQPQTCFRDFRGHRIVGFTPEWRARVLATWRDRAEHGVVDGGVYWQATGPRFETPAEIRLMATFADVVGMTIGSECTFASELELAYAAVCVVDNLANGLGAVPLTIAEFEANKAANQAKLLTALAAVLPALAA